MNRGVALALALLLASCGAAEETPGAVSPEEARQLDEAAAKADINAAFADNGIDAAP